jgi:flagellar hook assembly protein FlgD
MVVDFNPHLSDGEYVLRVKGKNFVNSLSDTAGITKRFLVVNEVELLNVYNYPNPFSINTWFTFQCTQLPDDVRIKIFTVAGRLIKEINSGFKQDGSFVKVLWDGRDNDGDPLANGVYFYKVIMKKGEKTVNTTQKLAIIK